MSKTEDIRKELEIIRKRNGGLCRPADVVAYARNKGTALHDQFTWDDGDAAEKYRLWEARQVIRVHVTVLPNDAKPIRAFVSLRSDRDTGGGYRTIEDVMAKNSWREELLDQAMAEQQLWQSKYEHLVELAPLFEAREKVAAQLAKAKTKANGSSKGVKKKGSKRTRNRVAVSASAAT